MSFLLKVRKSLSQFHQTITKPDKLKSIAHSKNIALDSIVDQMDDVAIEDLSNLFECQIGFVENK